MTPTSPDESAGAANMAGRTARAAALAGLLIALAAPPAIAADDSSEPFEYFRNAWCTIGLKDYAWGTRVTPRNRLLLGGGRRLALRVGSLSTVLERHTRQLLHGWMPVVELTVVRQGVRYEIKLWASPMPDARDWEAAFDGPVPGENYLNWVLVRATNTGTSAAEARVAAEELDVAGSHPVGVFTQQLEPGQSASGAFAISFLPAQASAPAEVKQAELWLERTEDYWRTLMASGARISVPCRKADAALRAAHVCQMLASDNGVLQGGEGLYDELFIRDAAYQALELAEAGWLTQARSTLEEFLQRQLMDDVYDLDWLPGRFESQPGQLDANGQAMWALWHHYLLTGDRDWLARVYPNLHAAARWVMLTRRQAPANSRFAGLLPKAVADGEYLWDGEHHIVGYDFWNLRGLLCAAAAARELGRTEDAAKLSGEADSYRAAIDKASQRTGLKHFPPSWEGEGSHWGNTETLWPTELFARDDPRVVALIQHLRHEFGGGYAEGTIRWRTTEGAGVIHPYLGIYTTMASLARGEHEKVVEDFYWYLLHSTATHSFPEGVHFRQKVAWAHTIPHPTGAANYAILLRHMLLDERDGELHLLPAVPDAWLDAGKEIRVVRAPTQFGLVSLTVSGTPDGVRVTLEPPRRKPPTRILLHLPRSRRLLETVDGTEVAVRDDQKTRWDWDTVLAAYRRESVPAATLIAGQVALPLAETLQTEDCVLLDLSAHANTNPFTSPFGLPNPGKYIFADLPVGVQTVGGVPFRILDPATHAGRGVVVLHSPLAPENRRWPREVTIPVGQKGRRLFVLGNVAGWASKDEAADTPDPVAEYAVHYADGTVETIPLVLGRTMDDWTDFPIADDVHVGLEGAAWHLNTLGVSLRPLTIDKLVFRDAGTVSAPVLVAVTLQKL
jgi:hypothetical protein